MIYLLLIHLKGFKGDIMKRVHFKEFVKKLKELKQSGNKQTLEKFRNTKVSELHYLFK